MQAQAQAQARGDLDNLSNDEVARVVAGHVGRLVEVQKNEVDLAQAKVPNLRFANQAKAALDKVAQVGLCDRCGLPGHEKQACWLGGQAWRCAESDKVQCPDGPTNSWTLFRRVKDFMKAETEARRLAEHRIEIARLR